MRRIALVVAGCVLAGAAFLGIGYSNAQKDPRVESIRLPLEGLGDREIRVLHLTDSHYSQMDMRGPRLERIVAQANALKPDLVVLTGDYMGGKFIDWPASRLEDALRPLEALYAPMGVYAAMGNHDNPHWTPIVMGRQKSPKLLVNANLDIGPLVIVALQSAAHYGGTSMVTAMQNIVPDKPILLLVHEGDSLQIAPVPKDRPSLALAGHTHGGQLVFPLIGPIRSLFGEKTLCLRWYCEINGWRLFVNNGLGTSGLPLRFGAPPEMVMITLYSTGRNSGTDK